MKTIQMTIDESLLEALDRVRKTSNTSRSAFIRDAVKAALQQRELRQLEARHIAGYQKQPPEPGEFDIWRDEQAWESS